MDIVGTGPVNAQGVQGSHIFELNRSGQHSGEVGFLVDLQWCRSNCHFSDHTFNAIVNRDLKSEHLSFTVIGIGSANVNEMGNNGNRQGRQGGRTEPQSVARAVLGKFVLFERGQGNDLSLVLDPLKRIIEHLVAICVVGHHDELGRKEGVQKRLSISFGSLME
ncbi:unnamed protein product [Sphagnum jensenii]|uniref:Uncharacterized protein n=1 Tax=Sphagnum jensenii TaxID=128206 RepID=A0ABP0VF08_9BRYO